ncbi:MAG TPA: nitrilase-related carbon-nitrogen hydrolase [Candidatus Limnocylindria bacterium]|nr:nitrilase-related carbon-nitrogen hydrolase [Candidatus Limnocylindria bacterium]
MCNEALFAEPAPERVRDGATLLLALANDTWVGSAKYAEQALAMTVVRAVEQRRTLVRASTAGPSAIVAASGWVTARTEAFAPTTLAGTVAPRSDLTPYARLGDLFALVCAAAVLAACRAPR